MKKIRHILLIVVFSVLGINNTLGQNKVDLAIGLGIPEYLNFDVRYQLNQSQIAIGLGSFPQKDKSLIIISTNYYYHFGGISNLSDRKPWYGRIGYSFTQNQNKNKTEIYKSVDLNICAGREFNLSTKLGLNFDLGVSINNYYYEKKPPQALDINVHLPVFPIIKIGLFYHL